MSEGIRDSLQVVVFVQLNDLYHIDSLMDATDPDSFVLPRVAAILNRLRLEYGEERVIFCLPGDFLNPSCLSRTHLSKQMIDVLNKMGLKVVTFGNHEFDFEKKGFNLSALGDRIAESKFQWLASNLKPSGVLGDRIKTELQNCSGMMVLQIAPDHVVILFGLLYKSSYAGVGEFDDPKLALPQLIRKAIDEVTRQFGDFKGARLTLVALTHQDVAADEAMAKAFPQIRLIMGGHDHEVMRKVMHDKDGSLIVKGLSNARSVRLNFVGWLPANLAKRYQNDAGGYDPDFLELAAKSTLHDAMECALAPQKALEGDQGSQVREYIAGYQNQMFDPAGVVVHGFKDDGCVIVATAMLDTTHPGFKAMAEADPATETLIREWVGESEEHKRFLCVAPVKLDTDDDSGRSGSTNFGNFVADLFAGRQGLGGAGRPIADIGFVNGGSFRLDRKILSGERMTEATICDLLFHDNDLRIFKLLGSMVSKIIEQALQHRRGGEFLQVSGLRITVHRTQRATEDAVESIFIAAPNHAQVVLEHDRYYRVATTSYVAKKSCYAGFFKSGAEETIVAPSVREMATEEIRANGLRIATDERRWILPD